MTKSIASLLCLLLLSCAVAAQKKAKPWTEWSEKEVQKMLNDSPWGQTQTETNTAEMFYRPTSDPRLTRSRDRTGGNDEERTTQGALNQATNLNYHIRLLTARPIRQAIARRAQLANPQLTEQLKAFAEQQSDKYIVIAVDLDSSDRRLSGPAMQLLGSLNTGALKNNTYLETRDGRRIFLQEYLAPLNDGMGAKFVFPRLVNDEPFVTDASGYLRFYAELDKNLKLNMRFKVSEMNYDGKLEY